MERALRRARVPMAFSADYSPYPEISYLGSAAPTGVASEAEYLEISVVRRCDPDTLAGEPGAALPCGLDVLGVVEMDDAPGVEAERVTKRGRQSVDVRAVLLPCKAERRAETTDVAPCAILPMVVRHKTPAVRPDDILAGLRQVAGLAPPSPSLVTRLARGLPDAESAELADPLAQRCSAWTGFPEPAHSGGPRETVAEACSVPGAALDDVGA